MEILQQPIRFFEISGYWSYHAKQNRGYHVKEHKKMCQKLVSKVTLHFVWGQLSREQTVPRYVMICVLRNQSFFKEKYKYIDCVSDHTWHISELIRGILLRGRTCRATNQNFFPSKGWSSNGPKFSVGVQRREVSASTYCLPRWNLDDMPACFFILLSITRFSHFLYGFRL